MYELQVVHPPGFEGLGDVELRELDYGAIRAAQAVGRPLDRTTEALFAASLHIDGAPIGLEGLDALPGRMFGAIQRAVERCLDMHGMLRAPAVDTDDTEPAEEPPEGEV